MKRLLYYMALMALAAIGSWSCTLDRGSGVEYLPVKLLWDDNWGFVDAEGRLWMDNRFAGQVSAVFNGYFSVRDTAGSVTVFRASANPAAVAGLSGLTAAGFMSEGLMPVVTASGKLQAVDGFGRVRFSLSALAGRKIVRTSVMFRCGLLSVCNDLGNWGAVDTDGRLVIAPKYSSELVFVDGYARGVETSGFGASESYRNTIVDTDGRITFTFDDDMYPLEVSFHGNLMAYSQGERFGLVTPKGEIMQLPAIVKGIADFDDTYIIYVGENGHKGLMTHRGEVVLRARYSTLEFGARGRLLASNSQHYFLIDYSGRATETFGDADEVVYLGQGCDDLTARSDFAYAARYGSLWSLYDRSGCRSGYDEFALLDLDFFFGAKELWVENGPVASEPAVEELGPATDSLAVDTMNFATDSLVAMH